MSRTNIPGPGQIGDCACELKHTVVGPPRKLELAHGSLHQPLTGTILPGAGSIYISQTLGFHLPVRPGDDVTVRIAVLSVDQESARVELNCQGFVDGKLIMDGVAVVRVPRRRRPAKD